MSCGEIGLLPAVRAAEADTLIVADGFSCKTQLEQAGVGRTALHTAQVIKMARDQGAAGIRGPRPERLRPRPPAPHLAFRVARIAAVMVAAGLLVGAAVRGFVAAFAGAPPSSPRPRRGR